MNKNHDVIEEWAQSVLSSLSKPERKRILQKIGIELRRRNQKRLTAQQGPDGAVWEPRRAYKQGRVARRKKMMLGLRNGRRLKVQSSSAGVSVGYEGKDARIARVHHYGLRAKPSAQARMTQYPARPLLGISSTDERFLRDFLLSHLFVS